MAGASAARVALIACLGLSAMVVLLAGRAEAQYVTDSLVLEYNFVENPFATGTIQDTGPSPLYTFFREANSAWKTDTHGLVVDTRAGSNGGASSNGQNFFFFFACVSM